MVKVNVGFVALWIIQFSEFMIVDKINGFDDWSAKVCYRSEVNLKIPFKVFYVVLKEPPNIEIQGWLNMTHAC